MIQNIIFDFGNVFISLNTKLFRRKILLLGLIKIPDVLYSVLHEYEKGMISDQEFLQSIKKQALRGNEVEMKKMWESLIGEFPQEHLDFIQEVKQEYRIFLLSNINAIHEKHIQNKLGKDFYNQFFKSFEKAYYSHHINRRKPDANSFQLVLDENCLKPEETLFVDDTLENIVQAEKMGIKTWHLNPKTDSVLELKQKMKAKYPNQF